MELEDSVSEEWYMFHANGYVSATLGMKKGAMTAPLFLWRISRGKLQIFEKKDIIYDELTLVSMDSATIVVRNSLGAIERFKILKI